MSSTPSASPEWTGAAPQQQRPRSTRARCGPSPAGKHVDPVLRRQLTRYGAPAAFLAAATVAVLLIKAGLDTSDSQSTTARTQTTAAHTAPPPPTTTIVLSDQMSTATTPTNAQYYVIQAGDTLGAIAARY